MPRGLPLAVCLLGASAGRISAGLITPYPPGIPLVCVGERITPETVAKLEQLRNQAIEYSKFPTSTFEVTEAMPLPDGLASGQAVKTTLKGKLTLHGVTKDVQVPVEAQLKDGLLVVVGNIDIKFADYAINKPQGASVLSIEDHGIMELQLILKKG